MDDDEQSHRFHIHINDFLVMSVNGQPYNAHGLQDTVVLPGHGEVEFASHLTISPEGLSITATLYFMEMAA